MADSFHKPLSRTRWLRGLRDVSQACGNATAGQQADLIRRMRDLLVQAPEQGVLAGLAVPDAARLEALLATRCWDSAALAMLNDDAGYLLSRGECGQHLASVVLPGQLDETICAGSTLALALVAAIASALLDETSMAFPEYGTRVSRYLN